MKYLVYLLLLVIFYPIKIESKISFTNVNFEFNKKSNDASLKYINNDNGSVSVEMFINMYNDWAAQIVNFINFIVYFSIF